MVAIRTFPTQYPTKIVDAVKLFLLAPATFAMPTEIVIQAVAPKKPRNVKPTTGTAE